MLNLLTRYQALDQLAWVSGDNLFIVETDGVFGDDTVATVTVDPELVVELEAAFEDVHAVTGGDTTYAILLFAARHRHRRPRAQAYPSDARLWPLFDRAGPETDASVVVAEDGGQP